MSKIQELIVGAVLPAIKTIGKVEMEHVLSGIKQSHSPEIYRNTLQGLHSDFSLLKAAALKTSSSIDDGIVDLVLEAVQQSAQADGIVLS